MASEMNRFLFLANIAQRIAGVDIETYNHEFDGQDWTAPSHMSGQDLEGYANRASDKIGKPAIRIIFNYGKKIYFPTEDLIKRMLSGTEFDPTFSRMRGGQKRLYS